MERKTVSFICGTMLIFIATVALAQDEKNTFQLAHWNILKTMYSANSFIYSNKKTVAALVKDPAFKKIITATFTPDSYAVILDQNTTYYIHPNQKLLNTKLIKLDSLKKTNALNIVKKAINKEQCVRGFYTWIDEQEKYMVVCPLIGKTIDDHKLYYAYTMYTRSIPDYYLATLKNSAQD